MPQYNFTLVLENVFDISDKLEDDLYELGCDDAILMKKDGKIYLDFDRAAPSLSSAIDSAVIALKSSGYESFVSKEFL